MKARRKSCNTETCQVSGAVAIGGGTTGARFALTASSGRACAHGGAAGTGADPVAEVEAGAVWGVALGDGLVGGC
jgi:hypothetical protein